MQLDPTTFQVQVANSLPATSQNLTTRAKVYSLENKLLAEHEEKKDAPTGVIEAFSLDLALYVKQNVALIKLELRDSSEVSVSDKLLLAGG